MTTQSELDRAIAQLPTDWESRQTVSGGWVIFGSGGMLTYLANPCSENLGEHGKPFQVNSGTIRNYETLEEALDHIGKNI